MKDLTLRLIVAGALACGLAPPPATAQASASPPPQATASGAKAPSSELDAFMARVLARRDETWRYLHDYVLDEGEQLEILGPGGIPLHRLRRQFTWFLREGFLVRSPLEADGVTVPEDERRKYEDRWLREEQRRAKRRAEKAAAGATPDASPDDHLEISIPAAVESRPDKDTTPTPAEALDPETLVRQGGEPRFIGEAYFLRFRFEPGNYYFVGKESLAGREVLRIEYYPTRLFQDDDKAEEGAPAGEAEQRKPSSSEAARERELEQRMERSFNKVALITLWVDPAAAQIVKYTFDNVDFGFLPFRAFVRLDTVRASMEMGQFLDGVWLPRRIDMEGGLTLANGSFTFRYGRQFSNYRQAETSATIRSIGPVRQP